MKKKQYTNASLNNIEIFKRNIADAKLYVIAAICLSFIVFTSFSAEAQEAWSLFNCVEYALENNIELNLSNNNTHRQQINFRESKIKLLPTLNLGSSVNMSFGRNIDGNTNEITFDQTLSNNFWINSSIDLFQGLVKYHTIEMNKYLLLATKEEASYIKNKLIIDVLTSYYTVLYSKGLVEVAQSQLALSKMQYNRIQKLVDIGRESPITLLELKSQCASDKLSQTQALNNYNKTLLALKQLLRLDAGEVFSIDTLEISSLVVTPVENIDSLFNVAENILPEIKQQEYIIKASEKDLAIAKGSISPRIYMSAGFNTSYFDGDPLDYSNQIVNNQNQGVNMGIAIPIFNNASTYSNVKRKYIDIKDQELRLQKQKSVLYTEIWKAVEELQSAETEYQSAMELYGYSELTLESATKKLETGLSSPTDYELAKQRFASAKASLLKARLIFMMRKQMLKFYQSGNWNHLQE